LVATFLGAHIVPAGLTEDEQVEDVIERQIPALKKGLEEGSVRPEFIDVFCEKGIFSVESTRRILRAGKAIGLKGNIHAE
jgi:imidazolonepropionase